MATTRRAHHSAAAMHAPAPAPPASPAPPCAHHTPRTHARHDARARHDAPPTARYDATAHAMRCPPPRTQPSTSHRTATHAAAASAHRKIRHSRHVP